MRDYTAITLAPGEVKTFVIKDAAAYLSLLTQHLGPAALPDPALLNSADFSRQTVFAVAAPAPSMSTTTPGLRIEAVRKQGSKVYISYTGGNPVIVQVEWPALHIVVADIRPADVMNATFQNHEDSDGSIPKSAPIDYGDSPAMTQALQVVIKSRSELDALLASHLGTQPDRTISSAAIDFSRQTVLGVFLGSLPKGCQSTRLMHPFFDSQSGRLTVAYEHLRMGGGTCAGNGRANAMFLSAVDVPPSAIKETGFHELKSDSLRSFSVLDEQSQFSQPASRTLILARNSAEMDSLWRQYKDPASQASMPTVDFSRNTVVGLFLGNADGCGQIRAEHLEYFGNALSRASEYRLSALTSPRPGPCLAIATRPAQLIVIPVANANVTYR